MNLIIPKVYKSLLDVEQTEIAIKFLKDFFERNFASELRLRRVTAPLFVLKGTGINDDLNGIERPVTFKIKDMNEAEAEVVHSLAKWKRIMLAEYGTKSHYGIYTDMNAIRADEELDNIHSLYVDQWDWELVIEREDRTIDFLKNIVTRIYSTIIKAEYAVSERFPEIKPQLPSEIHFLTSQELLDLYPDKTAKERENLITQKYGAVFIMCIGGELSNGEKHDGRAPDYDDWELNGDMLVWNPVLDQALELSSMGIRVDKESMLRQLSISNKEERLKYLYHQQLVNGKLPLTIGGGIGQSRLCMFLLHKAHVGEIQSSIWSEEMRLKCKEAGMTLL